VHAYLIILQISILLGVIIKTTYERIRLNEDNMGGIKAHLWASSTLLVHRGQGQHQHPANLQAEFFQDLL
jgi:hypothetical protein